MEAWNTLTLPAMAFASQNNSDLGPSLCLFVSGFLKPYRAACGTQTLGHPWLLRNQKSHDQTRCAGNTVVVCAKHLLSVIDLFYFLFLWTDWPILLGSRSAQVIKWPKLTYNSGSCTRYYIHIKLIYTYSNLLKTLWFGTRTNRKIDYEIIIAEFTINRRTIVICELRSMHSLASTLDTSILVLTFLNSLAAYLHTPSVLRPRISVHFLFLKSNIF